MLKSNRDNEHFKQFVKGPSAPTQDIKEKTFSSTTSNPMLASIPTVGYMGHKPIYRPHIVAIGAQDGKHFDLATTRGVYNIEDEATKGNVAPGFAKAIQQDVFSFP